MKIVDVADFYAPEGGGVKTYIHAKLRAAARAGHEMTIIAPGVHDGYEAKEGGQIRWVKSPRIPFDPRYGLLVSKKKVHQALAEEKPDLIEGSSPWASAWAVASYPDAVPRVLIYHSDPVAVFGHTFFDSYLSSKTIDRFAAPYWSYMRRLASRYQAVIAGSDYMGQRLNGFEVPGVVSVPFGVETRVFEEAARTRNDFRGSQRRHWLTLCGVSPEDQEKGAPLFVCLSRHHFEKRLSVVIKGFARFKGEQPAGLVLFGDGPSRSQVEKLAAQVGNIYVAGLVKGREPLAQALASADAMLHGSAAETFGLAVAEGMSAGLPAVLPNRGAVLDFMGDDSSEAYEAGSALELAHAAERLWRRIGKPDQGGLRVSAKKMRSLSEHFDHLFDAYENIASDYISKKPVQKV